MHVDINNEINSHLEITDHLGYIQGNCNHLKGQEMTKLLEKALEAISELPEEEQDSLATLIMEELASERRWQDKFAKSQGQLSKLAEEAISELRQGKTRELKI